MGGKIGLFLGLVCGWAGFVMAQTECGIDHSHDQVAPYVSVHSDMKVHADQIYSADDANKEIFNMKLHGHYNLEVAPVKSWFVRSTIKAEQKHSHAHGEDEESDGKDTYFEEHMVFIEQLELVYQPEAWEFFAGKFNPVDGVDQHAVPGFYGYEVIEENSILGRLGAGSAYTFETASFGNHRAEVSGFCRDTTVLNESLITPSGEPDRHDEGGIANTHDFSSGAASLSGDLFYTSVGDTLHEVDYVLSCARQDAGYGAESDHANEDRAAVGLIHKGALTEELEWRNVTQVKGFRNAHTHEGEDLVIFTFGSGLYYHGWDVGGSYSVLDHHTESDGHHAQVSLGYTWKNGLGLHGGWKSVDEEDEQVKSVGMMLSWHGAF